MKLIDLDDAVYLRDDGEYITYNVKAEAPSIDIVFCRECKYAHMTYGGECKYCDMWKDEDDNYMELYLDGDYYCASGERREP